MLNNHKKLRLILIIVLAVSVSAGVVIALLTTVLKPNEAPEPIRVSCDVTKTENSYGIINTGNVNVYVRVAVIANYVNETTEGGVSYWTSPEYSVVLADESKWVKYGNYYYCLAQIEPENTQDEDAESIQFGTVTVTSTSSSGYEPQVEVIANVIQATPEELSSCWGVSFTETGVTSIE